MSTPASIINVCSGVRLNASQEHTIYFASRAEQESFFAGKVVKTFSAYTYLRKSWEINVESTVGVASKWNYLYFYNSDNKPYYYFITSVKYINDSTVQLSLELDVMQTYMFDYTLLPCFVEREHVDSDQIGEHTIEESLDLGDFIVNQQNNIDLDDLCILVMTSFDMNKVNAENDAKVSADLYNGVYSGLRVYGTPTEKYKELGDRLTMIDSYGKSEGVFTIWMYPRALVNLENGVEWGDVIEANPVHGAKTFTINFIRNTNLDGYTPRNNKLYTHPYNFLYVTNNSGGSATYKYEKFDDPNAARFTVCGAISPEANVKIYPVTYMGSPRNYEEGLTLSGFPTCAWTQDSYKLWLAQNQSQMDVSYGIGGVSVAGGLASTIVGIATRNPTAIIGGVMTTLGGASSVAQTMAQKSDMSIQPPQAKGLHSTSVNTANGFQTFTLQFKSVDAKHAKAIDDYFTMYGYKVTALKVPNRAVRENWTYTKTIGCHISGDICSEDVQQIESIYNRGITFWRNGNSVGDYALSNNTL